MKNLGKSKVVLSGVIILCLLFIGIFACKKDNTEPTPTTNNATGNNSGTIDENTNVLGYGLMAKLPGIWTGPVTSSTALGGFNEWILDFRPNSVAQISGKSELDSLNDIFMSFFVVKHNNQYKLAFRNGGYFAGLLRITYAIADSVNETGAESYYRFSDLKKGTARVYVEVRFKGDSLKIKSFTNKNNTLSTAVEHMHWKAQLSDNTTTQAAITNFTFPKKQMVKDFSSVFDGYTETVFFNSSLDPYPETQQPYLGKATINYSFSGITPTSGKKVFVMLSTQPLISGFTYNAANAKYRSRYVILDNTDHSFTFNYLHPGTYYAYLLYDNDGNGTFSSGDSFNYSSTNSFTLAATGDVQLTQVINTTIP